MLLQQCVQTCCLPFSGVTRKIKVLKQILQAMRHIIFLKVIPMFLTIIKLISLICKNYKHYDIKENRSILI